MRSIEVRYIFGRESSSVDVLGIDVSKADFHACLIQGQRRVRSTFPNAPAGYRQLQRWLRNRHSAEVHACMEATGAYWLGLATALYNGGARVSVVNPSQTVFFARSQLRRTKTDAVDAEMIAEFCAQRVPEPWVPPAKEILELRGLLTYRESLVRQRLALRQMTSQIQVSPALRRLHNQQLKALEKSLGGIERQLRADVAAHPVIAKDVERLTAIAGIGLLTAVSLITKLPMQRLRSGKAAAAYAGLTPSERQSGTSVHGKPRICKTGNADLRRNLYMSAVVAIRHNVILRAFAERLRDRGKPGKVIIVAVMRKLLVLAFTILRLAQTSREALQA